MPLHFLLFVEEVLAAAVNPTCHGPVKQVALTLQHSLFGRPRRCCGGIEMHLDQTLEEVASWQAEGHHHGLLLRRCSGRITIYYIV